VLYGFVFGKGKNVIEMHFSIPYFKAGFMASAYG